MISNDKFVNYTYIKHCPAICPKLCKKLCTKEYVKWNSNLLDLPPPSLLLPHNAP